MCVNIVFCFYFLFLCATDSCTFNLPVLGYRDKLFTHSNQKASSKGRIHNQGIVSVLLILTNLIHTWLNPCSLPLFDLCACPCSVWKLNHNEVTTDFSGLLWHNHLCSSLYWHACSDCSFEVQWYVSECLVCVVVADDRALNNHRIDPVY